MDQVEEVKSKTDIVSVISEYVNLKKAGRNYKGLCPFHSEKTPSFMVSPELQIYKCFGCGAGGDVISFLQQIEGMDFYEALKILADKAGVKLKTVRPEQRREKDVLYKIHEDTSRFYNWVLLNHKAGKKALSYLTTKRGLKLDTIKKFGLGYSPNVENVLSNYLIKKKKFDTDSLIRSGIFYRRGSYLVDRFRGRVTFPLHDQRGNIIAFSGRIMPGEKKDLAKYINSPETAIYHKSRTLFGFHIVKNEIRKEKEAVIVEGEFDMISSWQAGIKNAVAIKGSALTEDQIRLLSRFTPKIILALDADIAGDKAARRGIVTAQEFGLEIKVCSLKDFKDPDDMARSNPKLYKRSLEEAEGVWDFYINSAFSKYNAKTGGGKAKISRELMPTLSSIPDMIVQSHYIKLVSEKLDVSEVVILEEMNKIKPKPEKAPEETFKENKEISREELLEERLLAIAFKLNPRKILNAKTRTSIHSHLFKRILDEFVEFNKKNKKKEEFEVKEFSKILPKELFEGFSKIILKDYELDQDNFESLEKELEYIKNELEALRLKKKMRDISKKISKLEKEKDKDKFKKAKEEFQKIAEKLSQLEETQ